MSYKIEVAFHREHFESEIESVSACVLTFSQEKEIRNMISDVAQEKLNMPADVDNYLLKQEYARGQLEAFTYLLAKSQSAKSILSSPTQDNEE